MSPAKLTGFDLRMERQEAHAAENRAYCRLRDARERLKEAEATYDAAVVHTESLSHVQPATTEGEPS